MERKRVGILVFEDIEVLDFCGPFEVFSTTRLDEDRRREQGSPFDVALVAERAGPITTSGGMSVVPRHTYDDCPRLDILVVPGGWGTRKQIENPLTLGWLRGRAAEVELLTAVCTGSMLLGFAGLLDGHRATTHWRSLEWMEESFPAATVDHDRHFVEDGRLWTSAGISAGIDMALAIVARCLGEEIAAATARHMEYPYPVSGERRIELQSRS